MKNILSVDVEDWFHILGLSSTPDINKWNNLESRVKSNFYTLLDEFDKTDTKVTCFFLGWVAEKFPEIVKEACQRGHEIASHGYSHRLIGAMSRQEFSDDIIQTKVLLENISGQTVIGYRSPGFSIIKSTTWALDELIKAGYKYDSSIFPASRGHGGISDANLFPHIIETEHGSIREFPLSVAIVSKMRICFFGGGYLRLFPYSIIRHMSKRVNKEGRPVIYYVHPREIDPGHPRLSMGWKRQFKSYINLGSTMPKLKRLLSEQQLTSFKNWLVEYEA
ncbi:MAG: polysaccharide deacetylase family protein [Candidatus Krumholzibacteria bacterium]|nr:polysaccharide deacetylase family protein [Candidatus Krumholzibacteria bacterium]